MKKQTENEDLKTDLKHDTMEFSAATDGDDKLDIDDETYEEEGITAEELEAIEVDDDDSEAAALNAEEMDHEQDEETLPEEDWTDDIDDDGEGDNDKDEQHRH
jgi:hypothetical protein